MKKILTLGLLSIITASFFLQLNNLRLYNPDFGFDGKSHQEYIRYIYQNKSLPLPHQGWEFNQPPLYYLAGAMLKSVNINPQFINLMIFYAISLAIYLFTKSKVALLTTLSLPMIAYFPPLISNELLGGFFLILGLLILSKKNFNLISLALVLVAGFYSKYTILTLLPLIPLAYWLQSKSFAKTIKNTLIIYFIFAGFVSPLLYRNFINYGKPLVLATDFFEFSQPKINKNLTYFIRLDWIYRVDLFEAKNYSFSGGLFNTFFHDGEQVIVPVTLFHKKALALWLLGFPLLAMSIFGLYRHYLAKPHSAIILSAYIVIAFASLVFYNLKLPYNFVTKSFYAFGLVAPYVIGLHRAALASKRLKNLVFILLLAQFFIMLSYFWIQPNWHNVKLSLITPAFLKLSTKPAKNLT